ncbi:hypothetical protein HII31_00472 [Pseudocercospora fuligena]|uniref:Uncharacterized protein n=1 Tax=Pseudocercospora fuligena TaxID=685502 RepID=A0A8H6RVW9_9PEZI|nr:hypothetical protein HII31_00472 [Pseudocercospora fuligena]
MHNVDEALFPDDALLEEYKGWTTFLGHTESELFNFLREKGTFNTTSQIASDEDKGKFVNIYEDNQGAHVNLATRGLDVLALSISGKPGNLQGGKFTLINDAKALIAENPVVQDHKEREAENTLKIFLRAIVESQSDIPAKADTTEIFKHVLQRQRNAKAQGLSNIAFSEHIAMHVELLRRVRRAKTNEDRKLAASQLGTYVFMACFSKMMTRFEIGKWKGKNKRNFYELLSSKPTDLLDAEVWDRNDIDKNNELLSKPPEGILLRLFQKCLQALNFHEEAARVGTEAIYGVAGRKRFQLVLSYLLTRADASMRRMNKALSNQSATQANTSDPNFEQKWLTETPKFIEDAKRDARNLSLLIHMCHTGRDGSVLVTHLEWLQRTGSIEGTTGRRYQSGLRNIDPAPLPEVDEGSDDEEEDGQDIPDDVYDNEQTELDELIAKAEKMSIQRSAWALTVEKGLELMCLHDTHLWLLTSFDAENPSEADQRKSEWILNSKIAVVDIQQGKLKQKRISFDKCLDELESMDPTLDKVRLREILGEKKHGRSQEITQDIDKIMKNETFDSGTYHCESILIALLACCQHPKIAKHMTQEWLNCNGIFAAINTLLDFFKDPLPTFPVSKRSCESCSASVRAAQNLLKKILGDDTELGKLIVPGHHTKWFATALPEWTPLPMAQEMLQNAKAAALKRVQAIQEHDRVNKGPSKGSDSEHSRTDEFTAQQLSRQIDDDEIEVPPAETPYSPDNLPSDTARGLDSQKKRKYEGPDDQNRARTEKYDDEPPKDDTAQSDIPPQ